MKKYLFIVTLLLTLGAGQSVSVAAANGEVELKDIEGHWAQNAIEYMVDEGAINGYPDGTFKPNGTITRSEFSSIMAGLMDAYSDGDAFADVKGHWAASVINGLVDEGVIETAEYPNGFGPNEQINRLEMSKMVARGLAQESLLWKGVLTAFEKLPAINLPFSDQSEMSLHDIPYIALANSSGIINGYPDGTFGMENSATRAEAAVMLKRYLDAKNKKPVLSELLERFKGEPSIHDYTKEEMEDWIDKETDLARLNEHPIVDIYDAYDSVAESNYVQIHPTGDNSSDRTEWVMEQLNAMSGYMDTYFNRDYRSIDDAWIKDIRYYYRTGFEYKGDIYYKADLPKMFERFVQETKDKKRISESIFVTDLSMVHLQYPSRTENHWMVRGTQYIRYISGTELPEGVELNKWYKRDVDVNYTNLINEIQWEATEFPFNEIVQITSYEEVTN